MTIHRYHLFMDLLTKAEAKRRIGNKLWTEVQELRKEADAKEQEGHRISLEITDIVIEFKALIKHDLGE